MPLLRTEGLARSFGGLLALRNISLSLEPGERRAIIGPNGSGKTTLFHVISGLLPPTSGRVFLGDEDVTGQPPHGLAIRGLARTFQHSSLFPGLTVRENMAIAVQRRLGTWGRVFRSAHRDRGVLDEAGEWLERLGLAEVASQPVSSLSYGLQRQLEVGLALATRPRLLLLDEPTAGMSPAETRGITRLVAAIPRDVTVLIVEHDMDVVFAVADRVTVLNHGEVLLTGSPEDVRADPEVQALYLGKGRRAG
jgi:branched-chain amino acid transport system ATP-binding protein